MVKAFLKKLFSADGEISSKRVVGFLAFMLIFEIVQYYLFKLNSIPEFMFWGIITLVGACFGLNALIDMKKKEPTNPNNNE